MKITTEKSGYERVKDILDSWNRGDFDTKDMELELFRLPQKDLVDYICVVRECLTK